MQDAHLLIAQARQEADNPALKVRGPVPYLGCLLILYRHTFLCMCVLAENLVLVTRVGFKPAPK